MLERKRKEKMGEVQNVRVLVCGADFCILKERKRSFTLKFILLVKDKNNKIIILI